MEMVTMGKEAKYGFWELDLGSTPKFFPFHKDIFGFLNVALAGLFNFSQFMKKMENGFFAM